MSYTLINIMEDFHMIDFTKRPETFFITYEDVIKSSYMLALKDLINSQKEYLNLIDFDIFEHIKTPDELKFFLLNRPYENILKNINLKEFDFNSEWKKISKIDPELYENDKGLKIASTVSILELQKFVKNVYIWTEEYDERIHKDITHNYKNDEIVKYVIGDFKEAINNISDITCYILNDINFIPTLIDISKVEYSTIMVANYKYNYVHSEEDMELKLKIGDTTELQQKNTFKLYMFDPM